MGTTLTGTTPQDTYDSLIKVTDNAPLTGSLKKLTDGLGNDSSLSLSTTAASLSGTLAVSGKGVVGGTQIGVFTAYSQCTIGSTATTNAGLTIASTNASSGLLEFADGITGNEAYRGYIQYNHQADSMALGTAASDRLTITSTGNVVVGGTTAGTSLNRSVSVDSPSAGDYTGLIPMTAGVQRGYYSATSTGLEIGVAGNNRLAVFTDGSQRIRVDADGLKFGSDTAAANALDDYEEGTWTMGVSFDGLSVGVTTSSNTGTYTKIGRQVTVNGFIQLTSKGSSSGRAKITGLPFTIPNNVANYSSASLWFNAITFANQLLANGVINETTIEFEEITEAGVRTGITDADFANNTSMIVTLTYFV